MTDQCGYSMGYCFLLVAIAVGVIGCRSTEQENGNAASEMSEFSIEEVPMSIRITSSAFDANTPIPGKFTADGKNVSPPLSWSALPDETKQLALIVDDPDAPRDEPFVHWVIYGIAGSAEGLPEGVPKERAVAEPVKAIQGLNDFGDIGYGGPAPPKGHGVHHYHFKLYALNEALDLEPGLTKQQVLEKIEGHVAAGGEVIGTYER